MAPTMFWVAMVTYYWPIFCFESVSTSVLTLLLSSGCSWALSSLLQRLKTVCSSSHQTSSLFVVDSDGSASLTIPVPVKICSIISSNLTPIKSGGQGLVSSFLPISISSISNHHLILSILKKNHYHFTDTLFLNTLNKYSNIKTGTNILLKNFQALECLPLKWLIKRHWTVRTKKNHNQ